MRRTSLALTSLTLAAFLVACSSGGSSSGPGSSTADRRAGDGQAIELGDDPRGEELQAVLESAVDQHELQSIAFGVWDGDEQLILGAVDAPAPIPATSIDARVRVGQPMEAMLGTILLQLDSEGVLALDEPVGTYVPDLVDGDRITAEMLASTTSGTPDFVPNEQFQDALYGDVFRQWTTRDLLSYAQQSPPLFAPGTDWAYSHTDMALLGTVLEEASGQPLDELFEERIFEPLGMSTAGVTTTNAIGSPAFRAYTDERGMYEESTNWNPTWALNSGNMYASIADVGRWLRGLNSGELLTDQAFELQMAPSTAGLGSFTDEAFFSFGSLVIDGWLLGNPSLQGYMGFTAQLRDPSMTIVVYSTSGRERTATTNASVQIGLDIAEVIAPTDQPLRMPGS